MRHGPRTDDTQRPRGPLFPLVFTLYGELSREEVGCGGFSSPSRKKRIESMTRIGLEMLESSTMSHMTSAWPSHPGQALHVIGHASSDADELCSCGE